MAEGPEKSYQINLVNSRLSPLFLWVCVVLDSISRGRSAGLEPVGAEMDFGDDNDFGEKIPWGLYKSSCT